MASSPAVATEEVVELTTFADAFDRTCANLYAMHSQMNAAAEERRGRLALWDAEENARHELQVSAHDAFVTVLQGWKNDAAKRAYTQRLMEVYYGKVRGGSSKQAEINTRRARLESKEEGM